MDAGSTSSRSQPRSAPMVLRGALLAVLRRVGAVAGLGAITTIWAVMLVLVALGVAFAGLVVLQAVIG